MTSPARLRYPAVPLVTVDPYFSIWSMADRLYDDHTRHWTTARMSIVGLAWIDGRCRRFCGRTRTDQPAWHHAGEPAGMDQVDLEVRALSTRYRFCSGGVQLAVTFTTPLLLDELDVLSRPVSYVGFTARSVDGKPHAVSLYLDITSESCVNTSDQRVHWGAVRYGEGLECVRVGSLAQNVLGTRGDDVRIDWGYLHLTAPGATLSAGPAAGLRGAFASVGTLPPYEPHGRREGVPAENLPVLAACFDLGTVNGHTVERTAALAYDDDRCIEYFGQRLAPWCFRGGASFGDVLGKAVREADAIRARCDAFDQALRAEAETSGGARYADLCALAYRQAIAAHKLVAGPDGEPLFFSKECFSNGCIATVDVSYPSAPLFLLEAPELVKGMLRPIFRFASSPGWPFPYAPHDAGTYPRANGQVYGLGLEGFREGSQMPVEECGNLLILVAAVCRAERSYTFAAEHNDLLGRWARYLEEHGYDPENQLCTDDFAGHLAHNTNLSLKAIVAIACWADLCRGLGSAGEADRCSGLARQLAARWEREARDGDHYRLSFDGPGTWSLKYNLVWDQLLGLGLFPPEVAAREVAHYEAVRNRYGTPLDSRADFTKSDWLVWAGCLAGSREQFERIVDPLWDFVNETPVRTPFSDWYGTTDRLEQSFHHRSVIGGIFMKLLNDRARAAAQRR